MPKRLAPAEVAASRIISAYLHAPVVQHDDGTKPGMHDLDIRYPVGRRGAVEVTAAEDESLAADYGALRGHALLRDERLTRGWLAVVRQGADVNRLRKTLPDVLHRLEQAGVFEASLYTARSSDEQFGVGQRVGHQRRR